MLTDRVEAPDGLLDGRTTLEILVQHKTKQGRDAHIDSGIESGLRDALDLLEQTAVTLR